MENPNWIFGLLLLQRFFLNDSLFFPFSHRDFPESHQGVIRDKVPDDSLMTPFVKRG